MRCTALIVAMLCVLPALAQDGELAGPIWGEGPQDNGAGGTKDAGATATTAQEVSSPLAPASGSTLARVKGRTSSGLLQPDLVDLYEISITTPGSFLASTADSSFDTAIFLFRQIVGNDGVVEARAIAMNDNASSSTTSSRLTGEEIPGLTAGTYYIAVTKSGAMPIGFKTNDNEALPMFTYSPGSTAVVLPTTTQATYTHADWSNLNGGGEYGIQFNGTVVTRSSACSRAIILGAGVYSFGNAGTSDSSSSRIGLKVTCGENTSAWIANPSWFILGACDGTVQISVCPSTTNATYQMVVYEGCCGNLEPVACGTLGACSGGGTGSTVILNQDPCKTYYVAFGARRVSGESPTSGGTITIISCTPSAPDADINGDGIVDGNDLALLLSQWGT